MSFDYRDPITARTEEMGKVSVNTPVETRIEVVRRFSVPVAKVWRAMTEPGLVHRWLLGPPGWTMPVCESDFRVGGLYEYLWRSDENEQAFGFVGEFQEIDLHARIVHTEKSPAGSSAGESLVTITFSEIHSGSTVVTSIEYPSKQARDAALAAGMAAGMEMSYLKLDEVLAEL